ncbi:MAG: hypothetical protein K0R57_713 [Paenibacillaceae bacterium]|nr:hypothetical protein [Paenibacillaceae bacterium]
MKPTVIRFKEHTIPVTFFNQESAPVASLEKLFESMQYNFEFRRKLKKISSIEMIGEVAVFKYFDGTKLYMEVS